MLRYLAVALAPALVLQAEPLTYPETRRDPVVETLHGTEVVDPYRWLENDRSEETAAWVEAQNEVTFGYLESIPGRDAIRKRLTELYDNERYGVPFKAGNRYFFTRNDGLQNQSVLYTCTSLDGEPTVLLDPNTLSKDGTVALSGYRVSDDGSLLAYAISRSGSDWKEWHVRDVGAGLDHPEVVKWSKFSGASWSKDNRGFYYSRYAEPDEGDELKGANLNMKVYYHRLGTQQEDDRLVYERPDHPKWGLSAWPTEDGEYLVIEAWEGSANHNGLFYRDLSQEEAPVVELLKDFDARYDFIGSDGPLFWIETDLEAPRGRVIQIDLRKPAKEHWKTLIAQSLDTLRSVNVVGDQFICSYMHDAHSLVRRYALDGSGLGEVELPGLGSVWGFSGRREHRETFYSFNSYTAPPTVFRFDLDTRTSAVHHQPKTAFDPAKFETRQVFYASKDGTQVPMCIVSRKGLERDGTNPTLLYGYGGFNISLLPSFSTSLIAWLELGGVYAVPNLRGGGEYGEAWHQAGKLHNKQTVFDDFIAAAEWLIENDYTSRSKLAISGGSNGGLLVGACMTQRPELFQAALPAVGVLDMLRFHKFTIGWAWTKEYGSPDDPDDFAVLRAYSPYHNLHHGTRYPSTLITTGDHDDRVVPAHSFKFAAALQRAHRGDNPVLIRIETKAGHGAGKPTEKRIEEAADKWAFLVKELGVTMP